MSITNSRILTEAKFGSSFKGTLANMCLVCNSEKKVNIQGCQLCYQVFPVVNINENKKIMVLEKPECHRRKQSWGLPRGLLDLEAS